MLLRFDKLLNKYHVTHMDTLYILLKQVLQSHIENSTSQ